MIDKPSGLRYNEGKVKMELLPFDVLWHISEVLTVGAKKYAPRNWEQGMSFCTVVGCLMRHLTKFMTGCDIDKETGIPHVDLVLINAVFLSRYFRKNKEFDDRPKTCEIIDDETSPPTTYKIVSQGSVANTSLVETVEKASLKDVYPPGVYL